MLGLHDIVEDGLSILEDKRLTAERKKYVATQLRMLFEQAAHGSDLIHGKVSFIEPNDRLAMNSFSLVSEYLDSEHWNSLAGSLLEAKAFFEEVEKSGVVSKAIPSQHTRELMRGLLECIRQERSLTDNTLSQRIGAFG